MSKLGEMWSSKDDEAKQVYKDKAASAPSGAKKSKKAKKTKVAKEDSDDSSDSSDDEPLVQVDHAPALKKDIAKILENADLSTVCFLFQKVFAAFGARSSPFS